MSEDLLVFLKNTGNFVVYQPCPVLDVECREWHVELEPEARLKRTLSQKIPLDVSFLLVYSLSTLLFQFAHKTPLTSPMCATLSHYFFLPHRLTIVASGVTTVV